MWPFTTRKDRRIADLEARDAVRRAEIKRQAGVIRDLEARLGGRTAVTRVQAEEVRVYRARIAALEKQLEVAHRRLDDAMGIGPAVDDELEKAGARERARRGVKTGESK